VILKGCLCCRALRLGHNWKFSNWENAQMEICHLGKYLWEAAAWEKGFGKITNMYTLQVQSFFKKRNF